MPTPDLVAEICVWKNIMNKRFTTLMTTLILSVFFSISASAYDVEVDGIYYNLVKKLAMVTSGDKKYTGDVVIPASISIDGVEYSVNRIASSAFYNCRNLSSVTIPNSVIIIEKNAFRDCIGLNSVIIPNSVTSIGLNAFENCQNLTSVTIPNSVTEIGCDAFRYCLRLTSVSIPNSITMINSYTFAFCESLTSVTIPNSVITIGDNAFNRCTNLSSVTIPNSVKNVNYSAFCDCKKLISITIPNSITSIETGAFQNCINLENVYCYAEKVPITHNLVFDGTYIEYVTLYVPSSAINSYKTQRPWSDFGTIKALEGSEGEAKKCETPTISFVNGELVYNCATEGVEYVSEIKSNDINKFYTDKVSLSACYDISVTAMKTGYDNSDVTTAKLYWLPSAGTLEGDNINNVSMRGIAIQSAGGFINISGLDNNEKVDFYGVDGKALGSGKSIDGCISFSAKQGTVVVAKIGKESIKIAVE